MAETATFERNKARDAGPTSRLPGQPQVSLDGIKEEVDKGAARAWWELAHREPRKAVDVLLTEWLGGNNSEYVQFTRLLIALAELNVSNATPERLFSDMKRITSGRRATTKADLVEAYMAIQRLGPPTDEVPMDYWLKVTKDGV